MTNRRQQAAQVTAREAAAWSPAKAAAFRSWEVQQARADREATRPFSDTCTQAREAQAQANGFFDRWCF